MQAPGTTPFAERLRHFRLTAGLSQEALAERAGPSVDAVRALERGRCRAPRPDTLAMEAAALGLSPVDRSALIAAASGTVALAESPAGLAPTRAVEPLFALPSPPGVLVGREQEQVEVERLLDRADVWLLTLTGVGGVGKTRLAAASAAQERPLPASRWLGAAESLRAALSRPLPLARIVAGALGEDAPA